MQQWAPSINTKNILRLQSLLEEQEQQLHIAGK